MSVHDGVNCDACLAGNFRGKRFKCLICYDYDLCSTCYENGAFSVNHTTDHPVQCILTQADFELYYGGETLTAAHMTTSFTCPYCGKLGFSDTALEDHVSFEHADAPHDAICPICAATPGADPNLMTDDLAKHLTLEHRSGPREFISFLDTSLASGGISSARGRPTEHTANIVERTGRRTNLPLGVVNPRLMSSLNDPLLNLVSQISAIRRTTSSTNVTVGVVRPRQHHHHHQRQAEYPRSLMSPRQQVMAKIVNKEKANEVATKKKNENENFLLKAVFEEEQMKEKETEIGNQEEYAQDIILSTLRL